MTDKFYRVVQTATILVFCVLLSAASFAADKLPPEKAGEIGEPTGQIAFIRNGNIWVINADGTSPQLVTEVTNADGRLSWSPDNRRIIFPRSGKVSLQGPDPMVGGFHKVYDLFIAYLDSAYNNNTMWWTRITEDLGSRGPEWNEDGNEIIFYKDMNANIANAGSPNYQICTIAPDGSDFTVLRKDWQNFGDDFLINPSLSPDGKIAAVSMYDMKPQGMLIFDRANPMIPIDSIRAWTMKNLKKVAPSWSPDGKWLAYVFNDMNNPGIYVTTPDLSEEYLVFKPPVGTMLYNLPPSWSPDGKWLTFATIDGSVWVSAITGERARRVTPPGLDKNPAWSKGTE